MTIDTIALGTTQFTIRKDNKFYVESVADSSGMLSQGNNYLFFGVYGKKAYYNDDLFNITISPSRGSVPSYIYIKSSIPRVYSGGENNLADVGFEGNKIFVDALLDTLNDIGVDFNIWDLSITRLDMFKNLELDHPPSEYVPVYEVMNQVNSAKGKKVYIGSSYRTSNKSFQVLFYDKKKECKDKLVELPESMQNLNLLRAETRHLKKYKVDYDLNHKLDRKLGIFGNLRNNIELLKRKDIYDALGELYNEYMALLFKVNLRDIGMDYITTDMIVQFCKDEGYSMNKCLQLIGLHELNKEGSLREVARKFFGSSDSDRASKSRFLKQCRNTPVLVSDKTVSLFNELKEKLYE